MTPQPSSAKEVLVQRMAQQARLEINQDLAALNTFVETHGSFAEMARDHYATVESKSIDRPANPFRRS
jgi:C4-dicarboxylate-specific signal transduction histidine kinase